MRNVRKPSRRSCSGITEWRPYLIFSRVYAAPKFSKINDMSSGAVDGTLQTLELRYCSKISELGFVIHKY